ncbi:MAG TPA: glycosyltransferase family 9 protein [Blastocatellia bacterium]|nr:glycosyltransferase family 9 protein [Blastocatellia bacterium]
MQSLSEQLAVEFLEEYRRSGLYLRDNISQLAQFAISDDLEIAESATRALFTGLVERLADSFEPAAVTLYNRIFSQVIQICRRHPRAAILDRRLREFNLGSEEELIARAEKLRRVETLDAKSDWAERLQLVVVLSRVTLGADVAITSVMLERIKREFPDADMVLVGGSKTAELFGGDSRLRIRELDYGRAGTTVSRLLVWTALLGCIRELTRGLKPDGYLIVDPDTRLTQLGLLPVTPPKEIAFGPTQQRGHYLFFPSREYGNSESKPVGELTSDWLSQVFGEDTRVYPALSLRSEDIEAARGLAAEMMRNRPMVAINFGFGDNRLKRAGADFEILLVSRLIQEGFAIILDKGAGEEESRRADTVIGEATRIESDGRRSRVVEIDEQSLKEAAMSGDAAADMLVWNGRIGVLAALIAQSNLYIGYDSAGQHIAAALGVPCIDVFAGFSSRRFVERWRPSGKSETRVVAVDDIADQCGLVSHVLRAAREMLSKHDSRR